MAVTFEHGTLGAIRQGCQEPICVAGRQRLKQVFGKLTRSIYRDIVVGMDGGKAIASNVLAMQVDEILAAVDQNRRIVQRVRPFLQNCVPAVLPASPPISCWRVGEEHDMRFTGFSPGFFRVRWLCAKCMQESDDPIADWDNIDLDGEVIENG